MPTSISRDRTAHFRRTVELVANRLSYTTDQDFYAIRDRLNAMPDMVPRGVDTSRFAAAVFNTLKENS